MSTDERDERFDEEATPQLFDAGAPRFANESSDGAGTPTLKDSGESLPPVASCEPDDVEASTPTDSCESLPQCADDERGGVGQSASMSLSELAVTMPELRERRDSAGKVDLIGQAVPRLELEGEDVGLVPGEDFLLEHYRGGVESPLDSSHRIAELKDAGSYRVVIRGASERLSGEMIVPFQVQKRRRIWPWILAALLLLIAALLGVMFFTGNGPWYDPNASEGIAGLEGEDLQAYLDAKVEEGSMNITVVTPLVFREGTTNQDAPGKIAFNNLEANHVDQKLAITLDDTGELVYESPGAISPGQNVEYITLNRELAPGTYAATATVTGYDRETHAERGALAAKIQIVVKDRAAA